jgi:trinucleotide repeat-containing gene 6 protein
LGLSNSTWSFNPSSASSSSVPSTSTPYSSAKIAPKSSWSDAPPPSADPWSAPNKPRGPPPGITPSAGVGPKTAGRDWSAAGSRSPWPGTNTTSSGGTWAGSLNGSSSWLVLRNLTPQIDGSTLKTLCVQHGPLHNFHLYLSHGVALIRYSTGEEAAKVIETILFYLFF